MTSNRFTFPSCGDCPMAVRGEGDNLFCHARPPVAWQNAQGGITSAYPPVGADKPGCALHPKFKLPKR